MTAADGSDAPAGVREAGERATGLRRLVYRSRATERFDPSEIGGLVAAAQARNRAEGVTGLIVYDAGRFLQWLEGPEESVRRLSRSIRGDPRHAGIEILSDGPAGSRVFRGRDMQLALRGASGGLGVSAVAPSEGLLERMHGFPETVPASMAAFGAAGAGGQAEPGLRAPVEAGLRALLGAAPAPRRGTAAERRAERLVALLLSPAGQAPERIDAVCGEAGRETRVLAELFDRAAALLGDRWLGDDCTGFDVSLSLVALPGALRRLRGAGVPRRLPGIAGAALVSPLPGEEHVLGSVVKADLLAEAGWDVPRLQAASFRALEEAVAAERFDAVVLSTSRALRREDSLDRLARGVARLRRASRNQAVAIVVGGRLFAETPGRGAAVGADAVCGPLAGIPGVLARAVARRREAPLGASA
jgi:methylmalonyl-CoA mutase cobalamin-binding subunit